MPHYVLGNHSSELYRKKLERWVLKTQRHIKGEIDKNKFKKFIRSLSRKDHQERVNLINNDNQKLLNDKWRILSLSSNPIQPKIWKRYADNGKGLSLIFNASTFEFGGAFKVYYPKNRLEIDVTSQDLHDILHTTILTKTRDWAYEEEYRVISSDPWEGSTVILDSEQFFEFEPSLLIGVVFGDKMNEHSKQNIFHLNDSREDKLEFWQLTRSENEKLSIARITP